MRALVPEESDIASCSISASSVVLGVSPKLRAAYRSSSIPIHLVSTSSSVTSVRIPVFGSVDNIVGATSGIRSRSRRYKNRACSRLVLVSLVYVSVVGASTSL